jgi:hypothetical protein
MQGLHVTLPGILALRQRRESGALVCAAGPKANGASACSFPRPLALPSNAVRPAMKGSCVYRRASALPSPSQTLCSQARPTSRRRLMPVREPWIARPLDGARQILASWLPVRYLYRYDQRAGPGQRAAAWGIAGLPSPWG